MLPLVTCAGDGTHATVFGCVAHDEIEEGFPVAVDRVSRGPHARDRAPQSLAQFAFKALPPEKKGVKFELLDCHAVYAGVDPNFYFDGFCSLVSQRAVDVLKPIMSDEIEFIEVPVAGTPFPYFILWVRKLEDVVDASRSRLIEDPPGSGRLRVRTAVFVSDHHASYAVRLPAWRYATNCDLVTPEFVRIVRDHRLTGFRFREGVLGRELEATDI